MYMYSYITVQLEQCQSDTHIANISQHFHEFLVEFPSH